MRRILSGLGLLGLALVVNGCASQAPYLGPRSAALQQSESDLLAGTHWAMCYSGFRKGQHPDRGDGAVNPSDAEILEDLELMTRDDNFTLIRMYDVNDNTRDVLRLIRDHDFDLKVMLGTWLSAEKSNPNCPWMPEPIPEEELAANRIRNEEGVREAIRLANEYPEIIGSVAVGNEALVDWSDHLVPVERIIGFVQEVQAEIEQPVTVAENCHWWAKEGQALAAAVDFASIHIYPIWEEKDIDEGLSYGIQNMEDVRRTLPSEPLVITEAGWASTANEFGPRASQAKQQRYYRELYDWAKAHHITTFWFEMFDESWKGDPNNPAGAEKHWGLFTEERRPKLVMQELYPSLPPASPEE